MKRENLYLVIMASLMLVISLAVIGFQQFLPQNKIDKMFGQKVNVVNETPVVDEDYYYIYKKADVNALDGTKLADIYITRVDHIYFYLELYVAIDKNGDVYAIDREVETKDPTSASYFPIVREYLMANYNGLYYPNVQYIDGAAGGTTVQVSRSIIKQAVQQVIVFHFGEPIDHISQLFGDEDYTLINSSTEGSITTTEVVFSGKQYTVYQNTGEGTYYDGYKVGKASLSVLIAVDKDGIIKFVSLPEDLYKHSGGGFYENSKAFLEGILEQELSNLSPEGVTAPTVNSDGSIYLVNTLLTEIKAVSNE